MILCALRLENESISFRMSRTVILKCKTTNLNFSELKNERFLGLQRLLPSLLAKIRNIDYFMKLEQVQPYQKKNGEK